MFERLKHYKEHISTITVLIGVGTVLLYTFGYVSEIWRWRVVGLNTLPENHIEFLYKGGKILTMGIFSFLFSFMRMIYFFDVRYVFIFPFILTMLAGLFQEKIPTKIREFLHLPHSSVLIGISALLLSINIMVLSITEPRFGDNLLFQENPFHINKTLDEFVHYYICVAGWWFVFALICHKLWAREINRHKEGEKTNSEYLEKGTNKRKCSIHSMQIVKNFSAIVFVLMFLYYPIFIGLFSPIDNYPMVQLVTDGDSKNVYNCIPTSSKLFALLSETSEYYMLYQRKPKPYVLKIKKDSVSAVLIYAKNDITKPESFEKNGATD